MRRWRRFLKVSVGLTVLMAAGLVAWLGVEAKAVADTAAAEERAAAVEEAQKPVEEAGAVVAPAEPQAAQGQDPLAREFNDPQVQQYVPQFRQLLKVELSYIRKVCEPSKQQHLVITAAGEKTLKEAVKQFADFQKKISQRGFQPGEHYPDMSKLLREGLAKVVQSTLAPEQSARYAQELQKRDEHYKRVAILNLVARLDQDLLLTKEQRDKLTADISSNWKETWGQQLQYFMYDYQFYPALPDQVVLPTLTVKQREIWNGLSKQQNVFFGWQGVVAGVAIDDEPWPEDQGGKEAAGQPRQEKRP